MKQSASFLPCAAAADVTRIQSRSLSERCPYSSSFFPVRFFRRSWNFRSGFGFVFFPVDENGIIRPAVGGA